MSDLFKKHWILFVGIGVVIYLLKKATETNTVEINNSVQPVNLPASAYEDKNFKYAQLGSSYALERAKLDAQGQMADKSVGLAKYTLDTQYDITQLQQVFGLQQANAYLKAQNQQFETASKTSLGVAQIQADTQRGQYNAQAEALKHVADTQAKHWYDSLLGGIGSGLSSLFAFV